jgi:hypothetical protein
MHRYLGLGYTGIQWRQMYIQFSVPLEITRLLQGQVFLFGPQGILADLLVLFLSLAQGNSQLTLSIRREETKRMKKISKRTYDVTHASNSDIQTLV